MRPPVVLTHDGMLHRESWDAHFAALVPRYRVARWDRRGYGPSDQPGTAYSNADDLARVIGHVAGSPTTLVGCSYGALVSLRCALDHPDLVAALVLVGPVVTGPEFTPHFLTRGGRERPSDEASIADHIAYWSDDSWFVAAASTAARQRLRELLKANPHNLLPKAGPDQTATDPLLPRLRQITLPTLVVGGEGDIPDVHMPTPAPSLLTSPVRTGRC